MFDLMIKNAKLQEKNTLVDLAIKDGLFSIIDKQISDNAAKTIDAEGRLVIPPFVEPHIHLDTTLTAGEPRWNESGTLFEGIERWAERKEFLTEEDVMNRALKAIKWQIAQGILHIRTHVDTCDPNLTALKAMLKVKEQIAPYATLQIVAFPQEGIISYSKGEELLEEALKLGADVVGGIPHYEYTREYGVESIKKLFALPEKYDRLIDIHCDEIDDEQSRFVEIAAAEAIRTGLKEKVTVSHTTAMHSYNNAYASKLLGVCKKAGINFVANPLVNIHLQGRFDTYPKRRGVTRVKEMSEMGINVSFGHDDILDPWYPLGTGNMLQVAHMGIHVCQLTGVTEIKNAFKMITENSARTLQIQNQYGLEVGKPANLVILDAFDEMDAIRRLTSARIVISKGKIIAQTKPAETTVILDDKSEEVTFQK
ncbi:MAG: cytosine deaminase [Halanaerobiales bacterium]|nr:cytosine deaminase [Halanaerobiales bacterium]